MSDINYLRFIDIFPKNYKFTECIVINTIKKQIQGEQIN